MRYRIYLSYLFLLAVVVRALSSSVLVIVALPRVKFDISSLLPQVWQMNTALPS